MTRPMLYFVLAGSHQEFTNWCFEHEVRPWRPGISLLGREEPLALYVSSIQQVRGLQGCGPIEVVTVGTWASGVGWAQRQRCWDLLAVCEQVRDQANAKT